MKFVHTNIVARDWDKLSKFYIEVFGCKAKPPKRELSGAWLDRATGLTDAALEGMHLILPGHGEDGPTLEIFSYKQTQAREPLMANHVGFTHIAFEVDDVGQTLKDALERGATHLGRITEKVIPNVGTLQFVYFRDPENNIIEIQSWQR